MNFTLGFICTTWGRSGNSPVHIRLKVGEPTTNCNILFLHHLFQICPPVTTDDFINGTGHYWRRYTRLTQLCVSPQNTLIIHGRILWRIPITTDDFVNVSHYYWGSGRPVSVSDMTTTAVLCPPSGLYFRLHVWSRSDLIQSLNQYLINMWLYYTR